MRQFISTSYQTRGAEVYYIST